MIEQQLQTEDYDIFYRKIGSGRAIVFVHGFGEDGRIWDMVVDELQHQFACIVPDIPGSGRSTMKQGPWTMESFADGIKLIFDKERISSAIMIGHSMGGYITLAFVEKYADRLKGFGLFHSSAFADSEEKKSTRKRGIQFIEEHGANKFLEQSTPNLFSDIFKSQHPEIVKELVDKYTNFQDAALVHYYQAMMQRPDRTAVLRNYPNPVLFILGEHDTAIPLADGLQQSHMPRLSYIHILRNSGHMGMIEETQKCREILQKFLQETDNGSP
ncbi:MAG: alpha/beta fold hydrolase, partial [Flavitalea sp.]